MLILLMALALFAAWRLLPDGIAGWRPVATPAATTEEMAIGEPASDSEQASFTRCGRSARINCIVDGDTLWYRGEKIRIADINTPETSRPGCAAEAELGARATARLQELLNQGPFALEAGDRDRDRYDRLLRVITRGGESIGAVLVREGLAEEWGGKRRNWC